MLKRVSPVSEDGAMVRIADAKAPAPFVSGLEYGAPARGVWNIVHVGMLIPGAHEIYVCAGNCLRGVVLTAVGEKTFSFQASVYTQEELTEKAHNYELKPCGSTVFCIDYRQAGIGSACRRFRPRCWSIRAASTIFSAATLPCATANYEADSRASILPTAT